MTVSSDARAFFRHHVCEVVLLILLAVPLVAIDPGWMTVAVLVAIFGVYVVLGFVSDRPTQLILSDVGLEYWGGGVDRRFLAWSEIGTVVPRRFRGWPAENALVVLDPSGRPLLVASVAMFSDADVARACAEISTHVPVSSPVFLSPFTARADGRRRPELAPERTSERFLASATAGWLIALVGAAVIFLIRL